MSSPVVGKYSTSFIYFKHSCDSNTFSIVVIAMASYIHHWFIILQIS